VPLWRLFVPLQLVYLTPLALRWTPYFLLQVLPQHRVKS
jgi:hypothetical protein